MTLFWPYEVVIKTLLNLVLVKTEPSKSHGVECLILIGSFCQILILNFSLVYGFVKLWANVTVPLPGFHDLMVSEPFMHKYHSSSYKS